MGKWRVRKLGSDWGVWSPENIFNRFNSWNVAVRFAVLIATGGPGAVMAHRFDRNPRDGRCLVCEEMPECHRNGAN